METASATIASGPGVPDVVPLARQCGALCRSTTSVRVLLFCQQLVAMVRDLVQFKSDQLGGKRGPPRAPRCELIIAFAAQWSRVMIGYPLESQIDKLASRRRSQFV